MKKEIVEMVVLLNGNFLPFAIPADEKEKYESILVKAIKEGKDQELFYIKMTPDVLIFTKNILGWYFRPKAVSTSEQVLKLVEKELSNINESDDWKSEE